MNKYPMNHPLEKYGYGFKGDAYCRCNPPCGEWLMYHYTIDVEGKSWVDMGTHFASKEAILEHIVNNHLPTEYTPYIPYKAQARLEI